MSEACPCKHTTPCHPDCTCVNEMSSRGCLRCCSYGSKEQQTSAAVRLAEMIAVGDTVAIRGDLRINNDGRCAYTDDQLIDGKYLRHTGHGGIWFGTVVKISEELALVGGGYRPISILVKEEDI